VKRKHEAIDYDPNDYERPSVTVDVIVFTVIEGELRVLLIKRKNPPYKDCWAFPGGFIEMNERLKRSAVRELFEETGIRIAQKDLRFLTVADDPDRDPRTRVIGGIYTAFIAPRKAAPKADDDAADAKFFSVAKLPRLAFDHRKLMNLAMKTIKTEIKEHPEILRELDFVGFGS